MIAYSAWVVNIADPHLFSFGSGLELDSSAYPVFITRIRLMARYRFGSDVSGWAAGLGISF